MWREKRTKSNIRSVCAHFLFCPSTVRKDGYETRGKMGNLSKKFILHIQ